LPQLSGKIWGLHDTLQYERTQAIVPVPRRSCYRIKSSFYAAMKKNEMLSFADKWMDLENIILSEVSLAQKTKNRMFSLICGH
jgi:hypothetical protein